MTVIDVFSKYSWIVLLKNKTGGSVHGAFKHIIKRSGLKPKKLWTDKGREFHNKHIKSLGFEIYMIENQKKSCMVERWNRTMEEIMFKYFHANSVNRYINMLDQVIDLYNNRKHSSIKMTPVGLQLAVGVICSFSSRKTSRKYGIIYTARGQLLK